VLSEGPETRLLAIDDSALPTVCCLGVLVGGPHAVVLVRSKFYEEFCFLKLRHTTEIFVDTTPSGIFFSQTEKTSYR
jgi:hypothetical protein